jgi:hypothetical protein
MKNSSLDCFIIEKEYSEVRWLCVKIINWGEWNRKWDDYEWISSITTPINIDQLQIEEIEFGSEILMIENQQSNDWSRIRNWEKWILKWDGYEWRATIKFQLIDHELREMNFAVRLLWLKICNQNIDHQ